MKSFFWKFVICFLPCALAAWVSIDAILKYQDGKSGGFKLGTDLVGGTALVYEIDLRKTTDADGKKGFNAVRDINVLAESLKRRIDPNDLFNIIIRPAGGEGRVEIILPTGGIYRTKKAEDAWSELLKTMEEKWKVPNLQVSRGQVGELADRIQRSLSESIWQNELFASTPAWKQLLKNTYDESRKDSWAELDPINNPKLEKQMQALPVGDLKKLEKFIYDTLYAADAKPSDKAIEQWVKRQAWEEMMRRARERWPFLEPVKVEMMRILPDANEQLATFIEARGSVIGQAGLVVVEPLTGPGVLGGVKKDDIVPRDKIKKFIAENYGPSLADIQASIRENTKEGRGNDVTVEQVQHIKDLIAKVGSLEFRILANSKDDNQGKIAATQAIEANPKDLDDRAKKGLPPQGPLDPDTKEPRHFTIKLRSQKCVVTYSWVELGQQERHALNLDNAARTDPSRGYQIGQVRENKAFPLKDVHGKEMLNGALFFARKCEDRNLSDEERRAKEYEYFVLTRDSEFDPKDPTETVRLPKIDGSYLVNAMSGQGQDLRPAVHFTFDTTGGNLFGDITRKNIPDGGGTPDTQTFRHLAIILDGLVMSAPTINSEIRNQGQISGSFTPKEVDNLVNILRAGRLPATLKPQPVSESTMGATLGQDTIQAGVRALLLAFGAVLLFMIIYYRFAGLVASIALLANLVLTVGFMVFVQATFTLPGLAGLVLMLGMAVDANVLIYERLREERERGASLAVAIRNGYERALPTIIDTHLSSIFTAIVLYVVGNDQLKGFGVSLTVGLVISLFTSLYMTRLFFDFWLAKGWLHKLSMLRLFAKPDIDFMGIRNIMFVATIALAVAGITLFIGRGTYGLDIDFVGGTAYGGKLKYGVTVKELRDLVDEANQNARLANVQAKEEEGSGGNRYILTYKNADGSSDVRTVNLANAPTQDTLAEREEFIRERAAHLPDASVEQNFLSEDFKSRGFLGIIPGNTPQGVRIDQIQKDSPAAGAIKLAKGDLMKKVYILLQVDGKEIKNTEDFDKALESHQPGDTVKITYKHEGQEATVSVTVVADNTRTPNFTVRTSEKESEIVQASLDRLLRDDSGQPLMKKVYMKYDKNYDPSENREMTLSFFADSDYTTPATASPSFVKGLFNRELQKAFGTKDKNQLPDYEMYPEGKSDLDGRFGVMRVKFPNGKDLSKDAIKKIQAALRETDRAFVDRPVPDRLDNFDSQLATETSYRALAAIVASWGTILVYLWFRFGNWTFGLAAVICLIHDLFFTLGAIAACHFLHGTFIGELLGIQDFKINFPAVAALLTLVGYSVNDTIVVFDRIREVRGKNPDLTPRMINDSVNQTLSRTVLASLTTWLVVFVLYVWGGPGVHLFAFVMVVGVIVGTYSSIYIASPLLLMLGEGTRSTARTLERRPGQPQPATV
jgi:SecD/SecF fusion protein